VRRCNTNPALSCLKPHIKGQAEPELIDIESQALILVVDENVDCMNAEVGVLRV
jgi:hypothetical protein